MTLYYKLAFKRLRNSEYLIIMIRTEVGSKIYEKQWKKNINI